MRTSAKPKPPPLFSALLVYPDIETGTARLTLNKPTKLSVVVGRLLAIRVAGPTRPVMPPNAVSEIRAFAQPAQVKQQIPVTVIKPSRLAPAPQRLTPIAVRPRSGRQKPV